MFVCFLFFFSDASRCGQMINEGYRLSTFKVLATVTCSCADVSHWSLTGARLCFLSWWKQRYFPNSQYMHWMNWIQIWWKSGVTWNFKRCIYIGSLVWIDKWSMFDTNLLAKQIGSSETDGLLPWLYGCMTLVYMNNVYVRNYMGFQQSE